MSVLLRRCARLCLAAAFAAAPWLSAVAQEKVIYTFPRPTKGTNPQASFVKVGGKLYSSAQGGRYGYGNVFFVTPDGKLRIIYSFAGGTDGFGPNGLVNLNGTLYGTTYLGGNGGCSANLGCGTIFSISPERVYKQLHVFSGGADGSYPNGPLTVLNGVLYGATSTGGTSASCHSCGTVFSVTPAGKVKTMHTFEGGTDGALPTDLISDGTTLFGTTNYSIYSITPGGTETTIFDVTKAKQGSGLNGHLVKIGDALYGTARTGGANKLGTVFKVILGGAYKVLRTFAVADGGMPMAGLTDVGGTLYGNTFGAGAEYSGTVFSITPQGDFAVVYNFTGQSDGGSPSSPMLNDRGTLYGATVFRGKEAGTCKPDGCGVIYSITP